MFHDALTYPFRGSGWWMILLGAIFGVILDYLAFSLLLAIPVALLTAGYFGAFYLNIVGSTMEGSDEVPGWPKLRSFLRDIVAPFFRLAGLLAFSFLAPMALGFFADDDAPWFPLAVLASVIFGCLYFPMAVLATEALGGLGGALPHIVLPAVFKAMPRYLHVLGALLLVFFGYMIALGLLAKVPYVGWFLAAAVCLYGMMFQGRLIGLIYLEKQAKIGWGWSRSVF